MKTLIIGASGKIGKSIINFKSKDIIFTYNKNKIPGGIQLDITKNNLNDIFKKYLVNKIVLLSAITDPDECYKNKNYSNMVNVIKTKRLIDIIAKKKIYFIFFSSQYIFSGKKGNYNENSDAKPNNLYGLQKYLIEKYIRKKTKKFAILRVSHTYGDKINDQTLISNFISDLIKGKRNFQIAYDQKFNPLYFKDLKKVLNKFLNNEIKGVYNVGGPQKLSRYTCIKKIISQLNAKNRKKIVINKTKFSNFNTIDKRPLNVTMNINKLIRTTKIKMKKFENVANKIILENRINEKILERR